MTPPPLRPYQEACVEMLRGRYRTGCRAVLLVLPTGGGKTVIFAHAAALSLDKGKRVLVVVHRRELVRQAVAKLADAGVEAGVIAAGSPENLERPVQVCSVQTVARRLDKLPRFDLIILDEAHHAPAGQWASLLAAQAQARVLGVTATPARLDGKGLGQEAGGPFDEIVVGATIQELVEQGYLAPARCFAPKEPPNLSGVRVQAGDYVVCDLDRWMERHGATLVGDAVAQYRQRVDGKPAIVFTVSVPAAQDVAARFREGGYRATCVHGGTPKAERDAAIAGLATGEVQVLCSCDLINEGLDVPAVSAVILLRPTKSLVLYMQQVGRGMRPAPGKAALYVHDHVGNVVHHGLPDAERVWSLRGVERRRGAEGREPTWRCPSCGCANRLTAESCAECDADRPGRPRGPQRVKGPLAELTRANQPAPLVAHLTYREFRSKVRTRDEIRAYRIARRYKEGWEWHYARQQAERQAVTRRGPSAPGARRPSPPSRA